jgi:hypothetical protein
MLHHARAHRNATFQEDERSGTYTPACRNT